MYGSEKVKLSSDANKKSVLIPYEWQIRPFGSIKASG